HLFVARGDKLDAIAGLIERIEHANVAMAADAEHIGDLVGDQVFRDQLSALHPRHDAHSLRALGIKTIAQLARLEALTAWAWSEEPRAPWRIHPSAAGIGAFLGGAASPADGKPPRCCGRPDRRRRRRNNWRGSAAAAPAGRCPCRRP